MAALEVGDVVVVPLANGKVGLAQAVRLQGRRHAVVALADFEADAPPAKLRRLKPLVSLLSKEEKVMVVPRACSLARPGRLEPIVDLDEDIPVGGPYQRKLKTWADVGDEIYWRGLAGFDCIRDGARSDYEAARRIR